jgi:hypothetical protein
MRKGIPGIAKVAGALAIAGSMVMAAALPAAAAAPNRAYAALATGPISSPPIGLASYPSGVSPVTLSHAFIPGLLVTGPLRDTAGPTSASSTVTAVNVRLWRLTRLPSLTARIASSSCRFSTRTGRVHGTTRIVAGALRLLGHPVIPIATFPIRNSTLLVPGIARVTLNRQRTSFDGTLTVTAIYISWLHSRQTLSIGTSVCNAANLAPIPMLPVKTLPLSLGVLAMLLGGVGYGVRRRRLAAVA